MKEGSGNNLQFEYLHRDEGNYKTYGSLVLDNPLKILPEEAAVILRKKLIDGEYFYPTEAGVPIFGNYNGNYLSSDWYEFVDFSSTSLKVTDKRTVETFLSTFRAE